MNSFDQTLMLAVCLGGGTVQEGLEAVSKGIHGAVLDLPLAKPGTAERALLDSLGFVYETTNSYLCHVKAPAGWRIVPTDHHLYKLVQDPTGQARFRIMVHHQDRDSWIQTVPLFCIGTWQPFYAYGSPSHPCIRDSSLKLVWVGELGASEQTAQDVLTAVLAGRPMDQLWGQEVMFPPSLYDVTILKPYRIHTTFYHPGRDYAADSGSDTIQTATDAEAIKIAEQRADRSSFGYETSHTLYGPDGQKIWDRPRPVRAPTFSDLYDDDFMCSIMSRRSGLCGRR